MTEPTGPEPNRGELHLKGAHSRATFAARVRLLELIEEMVPEAISELQRDALPPFRLLQVTGGWAIADAIGSRGGRTPSEIIRLKAEGCQGRDELTAVLGAWQEKWQLRASWIQVAALQALDHWSRCSDEEVREGSWSVEFRQVGWLPKGGGPPPLRAYQPFQESRSTYLGEMKTMLDAYADEVEQGARDRLGAEKWPEKRSRAERGRDQHLKWLVRFQVLGETHQSIADDPTGDGTGPRVEVRTVQDAIRPTADLLGLTRRSVAIHE